MDRKSTPNRGDKSVLGKRPGRPAFRPKKLASALPRPVATTPIPPKKEAERIAKAMARAGLCSRREAEEWIEAGRVAVNGKPISSPALNVGPKDHVTVDGKPMRERERTRLFLYHKPRGLVTTHSDPEDRPTIFGAMPRNLPRLISIGRLDIGTEGLLLLTNDGGLARVLELPETGWLRRYRVRAHGKVTQPQLDALKNGITIEGIRYGAIEATIEREQGANVWITFAIREGKNREVKNVMGHLGLAVNRLIRVSFGPFQLAEIEEGEIEEVKTKVLREQLGERVVALAGADFSAPVLEHEREFKPNPEPLRGEKRHRDGRRVETDAPARKVSVRDTGRDRDAKSDDRAPGRGRTGKGAERPARSGPQRAAHPKRTAPDRGGKRAGSRDTAPRASRDAAPLDAAAEYKAKREAKPAGRPQRVHRDPNARPVAGGATVVADRKGRHISVERAAERLGGPEMARRERGKRPWKGAPPDHKKGR
jgi:23S rRNA pseudouridine2605 synthase